jgi:hypothetical protein
MSVPIQTSAPGELHGGDNFESRRGNEASQTFPLTGAKSVQVDNDQPAQLCKPNLENGAASRPAGDVSGLNAGSGRGIAVRPVDSRTIQGSTPGDHRAPSSDVAKGSLHQAAEGQGGPRAVTGQFPNGKADTAGKGGSFGNEHSDGSWPEKAENGD